MKIRVIDEGNCAECYLNYGKCLRTISRAWICNDSSIFMRIAREGTIVWLSRNTRKGLKLEVMEEKYLNSCSGCYLFKINRHCERISEDINLCEKDIIYKKAYED